MTSLKASSPSSHILRSWGLGLQCIYLGDTVEPTTLRVYILCCQGPSHAPFRFCRCVRAKPMHTRPDGTLPILRLAQRPASSTVSLHSGLFHVPCSPTHLQLSMFCSQNGAASLSPRVLLGCFACTMPSFFSLAVPSLHRQSTACASFFLRLPISALLHTWDLLPRPLFLPQRSLWHLAATCPAHLAKGALFPYSSFQASPGPQHPCPRDNPIKHTQRPTMSI